MTEIRDTAALDEMRAKALARLSVCGIEEKEPHWVANYVDKAWPDHLKQARAIRLADEAAGLRIVPEEATAEMRSCGRRAILGNMNGEESAAAWAAMLSASPFAGK